jgi:hypothetical protein
MSEHINSSCTAVMLPLADIVNSSVLHKGIIRCARYCEEEELSTYLGIGLKFDRMPDLVLAAQTNAVNGGKQKPLEKTRAYGWKGLPEVMSWIPETLESFPAFLARMSSRQDRPSAMREFAYGSFKLHRAHPVEQRRADCQLK